jgi:hypothetical protein
MFQALLGGGHGAIADEIKQVKVSRIARGPPGVGGLQRMGEDERNHLLVATAVGAERAVQLGQIVVGGRASEDDIPSAHHHHVAETISRQLQFFGGIEPVHLGYAGKAI